MLKKILVKLEKGACNSQLALKLYSWPYKRILKNEILLGDIGAGDVVLNIGCGSIPFTAIYLAKLTDAKIIAVDKDEEAIPRAKKLIKRLGLEDRIEFIVSDASQLKDLKYTAAIVALHTSSKNIILKNLLKNSKEGTRIVFREARPIFSSFFGLISKEYKEKKSIKQKTITFNKSLLYVS